MHRVAFEHLLATFHQRIRKRAAHIAERLEETDVCCFLANVNKPPGNVSKIVKK